MNEENYNTFHNYIQKQINSITLILNDEICYKNYKFNHRNDFKIIKEHIDDFINGDTINRYLVLPD